VKIINKKWRNIDPFSLRLRLTIGIGTLSILILGSLITWTSWKMREILIDGQKHNIDLIINRFPHDVQIYSEMMPPENAIDKAVNNFANTNLLLWVKNTQHKIIARSSTFDLLPDSKKEQLISLTDMPTAPKVYQIDNNYYILCSSSLHIRNKLLGQLFLVQDITLEQSMLDTMLSNLALASIFSIVLMLIIIAWYIKYSLKPLRDLNQMTASISAEDLGGTKLQFEQAPTEVKELALTLSNLLSRLALAWEREREFTSNVSHELRTPLTIVYGYLQSVLRRQHNLTEIQKEALETAASEAERTIRMLQNLLDLARADNGYLPFQMESYVLDNLVQEVVEMAKKFSDRVFIIEPETLPIQARLDYSRFKQVLLNLIDNAINYSPVETAITIKLQKSQEQAIIQVIDQGYGIPLQHQSRIFERFYRVDESRNHATGGCGLGLSIVKTLVEGMGGSISVQSKLGQGSIFTISLLLS